jgi:hypothetical protein
MAMSRSVFIVGALVIGCICIMSNPSKKEHMDVLLPVLVPKLREKMPLTQRILYTNTGLSEDLHKYLIYEDYLLFSKIVVPEQGSAFSIGCLGRVFICPVVKK